MKITNPSLVPPGGGFKVIHPVTGETFKHQNITVLYRDYRKYCADNGLNCPAPTEIEAIMCGQHPEWCSGQMPAVRAQVHQVFTEVAGWITGGMNLANQSRTEQRLAICGACQHFTGTRCTQCGCFVNFKVHLETSQCPISKW